MVMAMSITAHSLQPGPKLDYDVDYDAAVKGVSVVVPLKLPIDPNEAHRSDRVVTVDKPLPTWEEN